MSSSTSWDYFLTLFALLSTVLFATTCDPSWEAMAGGYCYLIANGTKGYTWSDARALCSTKGGRLPIIRNTTDFNEFKWFVEGRLSGVVGVWLGLTNDPGSQPLYYYDNKEVANTTLYAGGSCAGVDKKTTAIKFGRYNLGKSNCDAEDDSNTKLDNGVICEQGNLTGSVTTSVISTTTVTTTLPWSSTTATTTKVATISPTASSMMTRASSIKTSTRLISSITASATGTYSSSLTIPREIKSNCPKTTTAATTATASSTEKENILMCKLYAIKYAAFVATATYFTTTATNTSPSYTFITTKITASTTKASVQSTSGAFPTSPTITSSISRASDAETFPTSKFEIISSFHSSDSNIATSTVAKFQALATTSRIRSSTTLPSADAEFLDKINMQRAGADPVAQNAVLQESTAYVLMQMPPEIREAAGMTREQLIAECFYEGNECNLQKDFQLHMTADYGNCYTYNYNNTNAKKATRVGPSYGLRIRLQTIQDDYVCMSQSAGFRVSLQHQSEYPFPTKTGFYVSPGMTTSVVVYRQQIYRTGDCVSNFDQISSFYYYNGTYTLEGCVRACFQRYALSRCNCADPRFARPENSTFCEFNDGSAKCLTSLLTCEDDFYNTTMCNCKQPCVDVYYDVVSTVSMINTENPVLQALCSDPLINGTGNLTCDEYIRTQLTYKFTTIGCHK